MWWPRTIALILSFLTDSSQVLGFLVSLSPMGVWGCSCSSIRLHIHKCGCKRVYCVSQHCGDTGRPAVKPRELEKAVGGHQPSSSTGIYSLVRGRTGGALPEPTKWPPAAIGVNVSDPKETPWGGMRALLGPTDEVVQCVFQNGVQCVFQNWLWTERSFPKFSSLHT